MATKLPSSGAMPEGQEPGCDTSEADLRARVKQEIASYKVPRRILPLHDQHDLPWLDSGKINLRGVTELLVDRFAEPSDDV